MKRLIASDLHGSAVFCRQAPLALYRETGAEQLVLLGDLASSGSYDPRYEYDPAERHRPAQCHCPGHSLGGGQLRLRRRRSAPPFPRLPQVSAPGMGGALRLPHPRPPVWPAESPAPARASAEILLSGHTHVPAWGRVEDLFCANPGSVSLPRGRSRPQLPALRGRHLPAG